MPGKFDYREISTASDPETAIKYGVQAVPTLVVRTASGSTVSTFTGVPSKTDLRNALEKASS
jgi:thioredoxin-like negative regulator of GroEL